MDSDSDSDEAENICPICLRSFDTIKGLRVHWRSHSAETIQTAIDRNTQQQLANPSEQQTINQQNSEDFRCFECGFDAGNEHNYVSHVREHLQSSDTSEIPTIDRLSASNQEFITYISELKQSTRIVKRIPKGARSLVASDLSRLIEKCVAKNEISDWKNLLLFAYKTLNLPDKKDGVSLVQIIKQNSNTTTLPTPTGSKRPSNKQS